MIVLFVIIGLIVMMLYILLFLPVRLICLFENDVFSLRIKVFQITIYRYVQHPSQPRKSAKKDVSDLPELKQLFSFFQLLRRISQRRLGKTLWIERFVWHSRFGAGDAAQTGSAAGALWAAKGAAAAFLIHNCRCTTKPDINVEPLFQGLFWETYLSCMIKLRIGHAMWAFIKIAQLRQQHSAEYGI